MSQLLLSSDLIRSVIIFAAYLILHTMNRQELSSGKKVLQSRERERGRVAFSSPNGETIRFLFTCNQIRSISISLLFLKVDNIRVHVELP